jgi:hypothetical protein
MTPTAKTPEIDCLLYPNGQVVLAVSPGGVDIAGLEIDRDGVVSLCQSGAARPISRLPRAALRSALSRGVIVIDTERRSVFARRIPEGVAR